MNLSNIVDIHRASTQNKESTTITSNYVDCQGFEGCMFIAVGSTKFNSTGGFAMRVTGTTAASTVGQSNYGTVTYSTANLASTGTVNYSVFAVDCAKPEKRYLRCHLDDAGSTDYVTSILALRYGPRRPGSSAVNASTRLGGIGVLIGTT